MKRSEDMGGRFVVRIGGFILQNLIKSSSTSAYRFFTVHPA
jgi:hypothetical protein